MSAKPDGNHEAQIMQAALRLYGNNSQVPIGQCRARHKVLHQPAEVRDDRQLVDRCLLSQSADLSNDLFRRADEANLLLEDVLVGQLRQPFQGAAGVEAVTLGEQFLARRQAPDRAGVEGNG